VSGGEPGGYEIPMRLAVLHDEECRKIAADAEALHRKVDICVCLPIPG
jgi:hypothetical protein